MAKTLHVTIEQVLGVAKIKPKRPAAGRLQAVLEAAAKLPRRQQQKIAEMAEGFIALHQKSHPAVNGHAKAA